MNLTEYADRRGVSKMTISSACKTGRLNACVIRDAKGRAVGITDPELADREWEANSNHLKSRSARPENDPPVPSASGMTLVEAQTNERIWKAKSAELQYKQEAGELADAKELVSKFTTHVTGVRNKLLGIPSRAKSQIPTLTLQDIATLEALVREALEDAADVR